MVKFDSVQLNNLMYINVGVVVPTWIISVIIRKGGDRGPCVIHVRVHIFTQAYVRSMLTQDAGGCHT